MGSAIEAVNLLLLHVPLALQGSGGTLAALGDSQRDALAYLAIRLYWIGFGYALLFFAGFCVLIGVLIRHSRLIAHPVGSLVVLAGACYLVNSLALIVAPGAAGVLYPWILLPSFVGELSLAVWLLVKGVDAAA